MHKASRYSLVLLLSGCGVVEQTTGEKSAIGDIDAALQQVAGDRAELGAGISRLNVAESFLGAQRESLMAAMSRLDDADVAAETSAMRRNSLLLEAAVKVRRQSYAAGGLLLNLIG